MSLTPRAPRYLAATAILTGLALLGACSNGADNAKPSDKLPSGNTATTQPTKTSAAPTSTTPTKTPAPKPTKQGAIDTAIAGIKAIDHAYAMWDIQPLQRLSTQSCATCQRYIKEFPQRKSEGFRMEGGRFKITGRARAIGGSISSREFYIVVPIGSSAIRAV